MSKSGQGVRTAYDDLDERAPRGRRRSPRGSNRNRLIIGGAAVAVVLIIAVVAVVMLGGGNDKDAATPAKVSPRIYVKQDANAQVRRLNQRSADNRPMNKPEVFSDQVQTLKHGNYVFTLSDSDLSGNCAAVTWGRQLQNDLKQYGCTQIARGAYVSQDKQYVGQFIAINLNSLEGSEQILRDLDPDSSAGFVSPLNAKGTASFGGGFSAAYSMPYGHYAVVSWVERAGGGQPRSMNELLDASVAIQGGDAFIWGRLVLLGGK